ncbi:hypothetical protein VTG60DRAFT_3051 [Thermothelomyces hinnuleus]
MYRQAFRSPTAISQPVRHSYTGTLNRPLFASIIRFHSTRPRQGTPTGVKMPTDAITRVSDRIKHDHRELEEYYNNIKGAPRDDDKVKWQNQFVWELARHSIAEELVVYPAMEKHVPDGVRLAEKDRSEHQQVLSCPDEMVLVPFLLPCCLPFFITISLHHFQNVPTNSVVDKRN